MEDVCIGHGKLFFYSYFRCVVTLILKKKIAAKQKKVYFYLTLFACVCWLYLFFLLQTVGKVFQVLDNVISHLTLSSLQKMFIFKHIMFVL